MKEKFIAFISILYVIPIHSVLASPTKLEFFYHFFNEVRTFQASFSQTVLDDAKMNMIDHSQGKVWIKRPGLFRWNCELPDAQHVVCDGRNIWIYDVEMEQIIVEKQKAALDKLPSILLSGSEKIKNKYDIDYIGRLKKIDWFHLLSKNSASNFKNIQIGFEEKILKYIKFVNYLGQINQIRFFNVKINTEIPFSTFNFLIPDSVDVIGDSER